MSSTWQPRHPALAKAVQLIEQRIGLNIAAHFQAECVPLLERLAGGNLAHLVRRLESQPESSAEWQALISTLTIGETYFLRDKDHFTLLRQTILPALTLEKRRQQRKELVIWCAGCASGEEPYSVAITLQEFLTDLPAWSITILGTDINGRAIEAARKGVYRQWSFRHTGIGFEKRYFTAVSGGAMIKPEIQKLVSWQRANILAAAPLPACDIIFCRNVLLYLKKDSIQQVEETLFRTLVPGGWLLLGQAEAIRFQRERWHLHIFPGTPIYQKPLAAGEAGRIDYEPPATHGQSTPVPFALTRESAYIDAVRAIQTDRQEEAARHLMDLLAQYPAHARAHALLAFLFAGRQALPEAQAHLDAALSYDPLLADAHYIRAMLHLEQHNTASAREALRAALYCDRGHVMSAYLLGSLQAAAGNLPDASRLWRNARRALIALAPHDYVSDLSDMTAATLDALLVARLDED
ncbi:MAG: hypothetical protein MUE40_02170 [Anaerolineae bacterium]|jgi:chemotaxis protein methyltransferase CheR|nr:hypothetical protein [Anaerolineae bacterium]